MTQQKQSSDTIPYGPDMPIGDNSGARIRSFVERIENVQEELNETKDCMKEIYAEAKGAGFDVKILKNVIKRRKMKSDVRREFDDLTDLYETAIIDLNKMME